jgi:uncharacterized protein (DUF2062 family)/2-polyprenyl-3-methyl-5-hydroxy-6-metoxy-1,4-benzoquinol methylase
MRWFWRRLRGGEFSPLRVGLSVAAGLFIGSQPVYGLHLPLCMLVCLSLRLDLVAAYLAANISNPLLAPALLALEVDVGSLLLTGEHVTLDADHAYATGLDGFVVQALVGSLVVGCLLAVSGGILAASLARVVLRPSLALRQAVERTVRRYDGAPARDRRFVAACLRNDPLLGLLGRLGPLGALLEVGARRGQFGLCLLDQGAAQSVVGVEQDARLVAVARAAARTDADFRQAEPLGVGWPSADTILLVDVLQRLPRAEHEALLRRALQSLNPGGRIVLRDLDTGQGVRSRLTMLAARAGAWWRGEQTGRFEYRTAQEWVQMLSSLGMRCELAAQSEATPLAQVVLVASLDSRPLIPDRCPPQQRERHSAASEAVPSEQSGVWTGRGWPMGRATRSRLASCSSCLKPLSAAVLEWAAAYVECLRQACQRALSSVWRRYGSTGERLDGRHPMLANPARDNQAEELQIIAQVERKAMHGDPARNANPNGS